MLDCPKCDGNKSLTVTMYDHDLETKCRIECLECGDVIHYSVTAREALAADSEAEREALLLEQSGSGWRIDPEKVVERYA